MFEQECQLVRDDNARVIAKLRDAYVIQELCIKLNVTPAKIIICQYIKIVSMKVLHNRKKYILGSLCKPARTM